MQYGRVALCAIPALLVWCGSAQAQERRHVNIEGQVRVEYDSNVAGGSGSVAAGRGVDRSDTLIRPAVAADILVPLSRQSVFLRGSVGRDYYTKNKFLNAARFDLLGGMNLHVGPCTGVLSAIYQQNQSDLRDVSINLTRNIEKATTESLTASCGRAVGLVPSFSVANATVRNSADSPLLVSDYDRLSTSVGIGYRRPTFGTVSLFGRHDDTEYKNRFFLVGSTPVNDGYEMDAVGINYVRRLGARVEGEASISQTRVKPDAPGSPEFKGTTYSAQVDFRASSRIRASARLERAANPSIRPGVAYGLDQTVRLDATYAMNARWKLNAGLLQGTSRYKGAALGGSDITNEDVKAIYGGARWDLGRRVAFVLDAEHQERDANVSALDYSNNRVGLTAIAKF